MEGGENAWRIGGRGEEKVAKKLWEKNVNFSTCKKRRRRRRRRSWVEGLEGREAKVAKCFFATQKLSNFSACKLHRSDTIESLLKFIVTIWSILS